MAQVKVVSVVSRIAAVVFWCLALVTLFTPSMQGGGRMVLAAVLAGTATVVAALAWLEQQRDDRGGDTLKQVTDEYRRREAALIRTFAYLAEAPAQPQRHLHRA
jgi:cobalamin synthase